MLLFESYFLCHLLHPFSLQFYTALLADTCRYFLVVTDQSLSSSELGAGKDMRRPDSTSHLPSSTLPSSAPATNPPLTETASMNLKSTSSEVLLKSRRTSQSSVLSSPAGSPLKASLSAEHSGRSLKHFPSASSESEELSADPTPHLRGFSSASSLVPSPSYSHGALFPRSVVLMGDGKSRARDSDDEERRTASLAALNAKLVAPGSPRQSPSHTLSSTVSSTTLSSMVSSTSSSHAFGRLFSDPTQSLMTRPSRVHVSSKLARQEDDDDEVEFV
eukprot:m.346794 g.346794  ORF g.346794 m.346794 type:complete len:275 (+) comp55840_c0_seq3:12-836(+)